MVLGPSSRGRSAWIWACVLTVDLMGFAYPRGVGWPENSHGRHQGLCLDYEEDGVH